MGLQQVRKNTLTVIVCGTSSCRARERDTTNHSRCEKKTEATVVKMVIVQCFCCKSHASDEMNTPI